MIRSPMLTAPSVDGIRHCSVRALNMLVFCGDRRDTMYAVPGEKRIQSLTIFPVVTQDGGRDSWDLAAGDAPTGA